MTAKLTPEGRDQLIEVLIDDMYDSVRSDWKFAALFLEDVMRNGYQPLTERSDDELLKWHLESFDCGFLERKE